MLPEHAEILGGLYGLREAAPGGADLLAALGLGLLIAGLIGAGLGAFRTRSRKDGVAHRVASTRDMSPPDRIAALANLLRTLTEATEPGPSDWTDRAVSQFGLDPVLLQGLRASLYTPTSSTDPEALEAAVLQAARKARA